MTTSSSSSSSSSAGGITVSQAPLDTQVDYVGTTNATYVGNAAPGSATSASVWQIRFITYDGNNNPLTITFANGSGSYTNIWNNRASYTYS